jgi:dodecin
MSVAKVMEISSRSPESFEHAIKSGLDRAAKTVQNIQGAWIKEQKVDFDGKQVKAFHVTMKVTFILND